MEREWPHIAGTDVVVRIKEISEIASGEFVAGWRGFTESVVGLPSLNI